MKELDEKQIINTIKEHIGKVIKNTVQAAAEEILNELKNNELQVQIKLRSINKKQDY